MTMIGPPDVNSIDEQMRRYALAKDEDPTAPRVTGDFGAPAVTTSAPFVTPERLAMAKDAARAAALSAVAPAPGYGQAAAYALVPDEVKQRIASKLGLSGGANKGASGAAAPPTMTDEERKRLAINPFAPGAASGEGAPTAREEITLPGVRTTPGGMQLAGRTTQQGTKFSENVGQQLNAAEIDANEAKRLGMEAGSERAGIEAQGADTQLAHYAAAQQAEEARQSRMKSAYDAQMAKADALQQRASEMHEDPDGYWKQKGVGARIMAVIGQALGTYGAAITHTPNYAAQMIEGEVQNHIKAQAANIAKGERTAKGARETAGAMHASDLDDHQMYLAKQNEGLTVARLDVARQMANVNSKEAGARLAGLDAELREKIASNRAGIEAQAADKVQTHEAYRAPSTTGGFDAKEFRRLTQENMEKFHDDVDQAQRRALKVMGAKGIGNIATPNGKEGGKKSDKEEADTEARGIISALNDMDPEKVSRGNALTDQWAKLPSFVPGVDTAKENKSRRDDANVDMMKAAGATWKLTTGGVEPKNPHLIEEIVAPYKISPSDDEKTVSGKRARAQAAVMRAARAKGADVSDAPSGGASASTSGINFTPVGGER